MLSTDAIVIGAGPIGLFQVFQLGLQGLRAHVIDALPHPGGQCAELYGDKPIYDIPAVQACTGNELVQRLLAQIQPFAPTLHLGQQVDTVQALPEGGFRVGTAQGTQLQARAVFIATGVGAFSGVLYTSLYGWFGDAKHPEYVWYVLAGHILVAVVVFLVFRKVAGDFKEVVE